MATQPIYDLAIETLVAPKPVRDISQSCRMQATMTSWKEPLQSRHRAASHPATLGLLVGVYAVMFADFLDLLARDAATALVLTVVSVFISCISV